MVNVLLDSNKFEKYDCQPDKIIVCANTLHLFKVISTMSNDDTLSIYIDKSGKVRKIHTGFNGPATGDKFTQFKAEFSAFIDDLLNE